jgi:hypothetical protein
MEETVISDIKYPAFYLSDLISEGAIIDNTKDKLV